MTAQLTVPTEWVQSFKQDLSKVGFLDLPRELRDYVYSFAFHVQGAIFLLSMNPWAMHPASIGQVVRHDNKGPVEPKRLRDVVPMTLLRTCRQIRSECSPVLFGDNIFRVWFLTTPDLAPCYRQLIRHITFDLQPDQKMYRPRWSGLEEVSYGWNRRWWPDVLAKGLRMLDQFPNVEVITIKLTSKDHGESWKPAFFDIEHKTREHRVAVAARWLHPRCPIEDARLRRCLRLELQTPRVLAKDDYTGSRFAPDEDGESEWDYTEFADAFQLMKSFG
ncbi:hypothetical protein FB567DRAFT_594283 [Paraphoma chrysanthemicola]|uniref:DUF7730 domain-containing protein n=1 Tax=Paraphoma chrysanthemicola TaxID=798071 RepID=A0A8K0VWP5_9PLEO|nr:hypothetical protein FB567DRAFT_594283 [Paraphoma chrysanthemicola]